MPCPLTFTDPPGFSAAGCRARGPRNPKLWSQSSSLQNISFIMYHRGLHCFQIINSLCHNQGFQLAKISAWLGKLFGLTAFFLFFFFYFFSSPSSPFQLLGLETFNLTMCRFSNLKHDAVPLVSDLFVYLITFLSTHHSPAAIPYQQVSHLPDL